MSDVREKWRALSWFCPNYVERLTGYWEHVGMLDRQDYKAHWEKKLAWYKKNFPGQLLVTYEGQNLSQDALGIIEAHT